MKILTWFGSRRVVTDGGLRRVLTDVVEVRPVAVQDREVPIPTYAAADQ